MAHFRGDIVKARESWPRLYPQITAGKEYVVNAVREQDGGRYLYVIDDAGRGQSLLDTMFDPLRPRMASQMRSVLADLVDAAAAEADEKGAGRDLLDRIEAARVMLRETA